MKLLKSYWELFTKLEKICLITGLLTILVNAFVFNDSKLAVFNAIFGIMYTILAGKGKADCFYFGLAGSSLYCILSFKNALWGNLLLYALYYIPMQITGLIKWGQNIDTTKGTIIKTKLGNRERYIYLFSITLITLVTIFVLNLFGDTSPVFDGITTICSIAGMILTVGRKFEQWIMWIIVNGISAIMWINVALQGEKVYSTVIMWVVYFILAINFYIQWKNELKNQTN